MKRIFAVILATLMLTLAIVPVAQAEEVAATVETSTIEYFEDGSYMVTTIKESPTARSRVYIKVGEKIVDLYDSDNVLQWTYKLIGKFKVVDGVNVACTESSYTSDIYVNEWSLTAHNNYISNNIAYGTATYKKKVLFITTSTQDIEGSIGCNVYGDIS